MGNGNKITRQPKGTTGGRGPTPPDVIDSNDDLKKYIRDYENRSLLSIINELAKKGRRLSAGYYKELQDAFLKLEEKTGTPFSILSGAEGAGPTIRQALEAGTLTGTGSTGRDQAAQDLDRAQAAHLLAQEQIDRERIAEDKRQNLLNTARALIEAKMTERATARGQAIQSAGNDPFRFLAQINQSRVGADVQTPYDIFKNQLGGIASQQVPNISPNATVQDLESAISKLGAQSQPQGSGIGFAGGGMPGPYEANLVGEAGSQIAPGTEVMITGATLVPRPGETTILPLGRGFQTGGSLTSNPFAAPNQDIYNADEKQKQALRDQYENVDLTVVPQLFERLRSDVTGGAPYSYSQLGFLEPGQAGRLPQFGAGYGAMATPLTLRSGYQDLVKAGVVSQEASDRIVNAIGNLPNPRNAAAYLKNLTPTEKEALISAYRLAGISRDDYDALVKSATISGPSRTAVNLAA